MALGKLREQAPNPHLAHTESDQSRKAQHLYLGWPKSLYGKYTENPNKIFGQPTAAVSSRYR